MKAKKKQVVGLLINLLEWAIVSMVLSSLIILGDFNVPSSWVYLSSVVVSFLILYVFYWERGTYYFVSFVAGGVPGRVFLKFDENTISGLYSGERVLVTGYKTVSRYEYELNIKS